MTIGDPTSIINDPMIPNDDKSSTSSAADLARIEYDAGSEGYNKAAKRELKEWAYYPTISHYLGDLHDRSALDLGCGSGDSSRTIKALGSDDIVGIDVSGKQIEVARQQEAQASDAHPIAYIEGDAADFDFSQLNKQFDIVSGMMFIHYMPTEEALTKLLTNVHTAIKNEGACYFLVPNPEINQDYNSYGIKATAKDWHEGDAVHNEVSDLEGHKLVEFTNYYWSKAMYEHCFSAAEFQMEILPPVISDEGEKAGPAKYGQEFWNEWGEKPFYVMIKATPIDKDRN